MHVAEPVAIVGIGCRFPGPANSPEAFWELLINGRDVVGHVPGDRWADYTRMGPAYADAVSRTPTRGGYLEDIAGFDNEFFGFTHREAETMDPQHRLLLEVTWEALEHAGIPPLSLAGEQVAVFTGLTTDDYGRRLLENLPDVDAWMATGVSTSGAANRVSYALDLRGPSVVVDSACSASLTAVHLACQSLRLGESVLALAGGVNILGAPGWSLSLEAAGMLSPVGLSKAFSADADGYVRGEGGGVLVLKRLTDAERDGDRVIAVILGSSVVHDGRTDGFVAPSVPAQQAMLRNACATAGVDPRSVDYVEAHGTGTRLGDKTEITALSAVYGRSTADPCLIGSVKTNIGHLEAGAGMAGIIKAALALGHDQIPASLHMSAPTPGIDWTTAGVRVPAEATAWPDRAHPRRAGVSSFGFGGTISHTVLQQAPARRPSAPRVHRGGLTVFPLSARSKSTLRRSAAQLADWLGDTGRAYPLTDVGHTLAVRRSHLSHRATVVAADREDLIRRLRQVAADELAPSTATAVTGSIPRLVWVFSGHGSQWRGMGKELLSHPVFAEVIAEIEPVFVQEAGFSLRHALAEGDFDGSARAQMVLFAVQVALAAVWRSLGVRPDAVIGHSMGEVSAAVAANAMSVEAGARLISRRARLLERLDGTGAMVTVNLSFDEAEARLEGVPDVVAAISSSPTSSVLSGLPSAVEAVVKQWEADGLLMRRVAVQVASHSPAMDQLLDDLRVAVADIPTQKPDIPFYSTSARDPRSADLLDAEYWPTNLRAPVRLREAIEAAAADGHDAFLEVSPHPVVCAPIVETLAALGHNDFFVGLTLRRDHPEFETLLGSLGEAHCHGVTVDWQQLHPIGTLAPLPNRPWQHTRHWRDFVPATTIEQAGHVAGSHCLLGTEITVPDRTMGLWRTTLDIGNRPYPGRHAINGAEVIPASVLLTTFLGALGGTPAVLTDVTFRLPLVADQTPREVSVVRDHRLTLATRDLAEPGKPARQWLTCVTAAVPRQSSYGALPGTLAQLPGAPAEIDPSSIRDNMARTGVSGTAFAWEAQRMLRVTPAWLRVHVRPGSTTTWAPLLDAALSVAAEVLSDGTTLSMLAHIDEVLLTAEPPAQAVIDVLVDQHDKATVTIADQDGAVVARLSGVTCAPVGSVETANVVHDLVWRPVQYPRTTQRPDHIVLVGSDLLREPLAAAGMSCAVVTDPTVLGDASHVCILAESDEDTPAAAERLANLFLTTLRAMTSAPGQRARLWCLTTGVRESGSPAHLSHAPLWGLGRIAAAEHPDVWGGIIDLDPGDPTSVVPVLASIMLADPHEDVISVRPQGISVARLAPVNREPLGQPTRCRPDSTYLITGGLGSLAPHIAQRLADRGARRIVLASRRDFPSRSSWDQVTDPATSEQIRWIKAIEAQGVTVKVVTVDIADADAVARHLNPDALCMPPIRGIVHAAGVLASQAMASTDERSLAEVLRSKTLGTWTLHRLFPPGSVDFLVLFSSNGHLAGMPGQAAYAAGNAFLDAFATYRGDTTAIGWPLWRGSTIAENRAITGELAARGIGDISAGEAARIWDLIETLGPGYWAVLGTTRPTEEQPTQLPLLEETCLVHEPFPSESERRSYTDLPHEQLREQLLAEVVTLISAEMRILAVNLEPDASLIDQGLDSVMALVLRRKLEKQFGHKVPVNMLWQKPTAAAIAEHLGTLLSASTP